MKLSPETLAILHNFAQVNNQIFLKEGSVVRSMSPQSTILAKADIEEKLPLDFPIYDLGNFLNVISLFEEAELEFSEKYVRVYDDKSSFDFYASSPRLVKEASEKEVKMPDDSAQFDISENQLKELFKVTSKIRGDNWTFIGDGKTVHVEIRSEDSASNVFRTDICETDDEFTVKFATPSLPLLHDDYTVTVAEAGIGKFVSVNSELTYWIAAEADED